MPLPDLRDPLDLDVERVARCLRAMSSVSDEHRAAVGTFLTEVLPVRRRTALGRHLRVSSGSTLAAIVTAVVFDARSQESHENDLLRGSLADLEAALTRLRRAVSPG